MNERIKELAEQHERIWNLYTIGPVQRAEVEGFVEAIVRECAMIALREDHEPSECILTHFEIDE